MTSLKHGLNFIQKLKKIPSYSQVSLIIPAHKLDKTLETCLKSIEQLDELPLEVIVGLDNVQNEGQFFDQFTYPIKVVASPYSVNKGPAVIRNHVAKQAKGDLLFFTDSDVTLLPNCIQKAREIFTAYPDIVALIGSYDDEPLYQTLVSKFRNLLHHYTHQNGNEDAQTFWGACGLIKKEIFEEIGGFSEAYPKPSIEDIELGYRLKDKGYQLRLDKDLQVKHLKKWTFYSMVYTDVFCRAKPWTELLSGNKLWSEMNDLNIRAKDKLSLVLYLVILLALAILLFQAWVGLFMILGCALAIIFMHKDFYAFLLKKFAAYWFIPLFLLHLSYLNSALCGYGLGLLSHYAKPFKKTKQS